ncbi:MAG: hypothetical protein LUI85_03750 [Bacteroides sp.]|nr:hypothetical protein [Bacteroides sp.]
MIENISIADMSDEDKIGLASELIAGLSKSKLEYFQKIFKGNERDELPSMKEIQAEVDAVRQQLNEKQKRS